MPIEIGSEIEGKITGIANFGAFIELPEGKAGLVHISQVADTYVKDISKHLNVGDVVRVKVLGVAKGDKYDLSIKQVGKAAWEQRKPKPRDQNDRPTPGTFEDKITQFLKQSDEKLQDFKRNRESKQGIKKKKKRITQ
ncbi:MAG: S1 RNA-binding domain-containing protein [Candidatus Saganbacteria bacterium]|nr:S1 RNA-binding domain-containing protein [Candidatus Saganbacteria bacterium]